MADTATACCSDLFRFADLPKEMRLIIYDSLPVWTVHHDIESAWDSYEASPDLPRQSDQYGNIQATYHGAGAPKPTITLVHAKFRSLAILRICRWITSEAGTVLQPKLRAMRLSPVQIVVNSWALRSLELRDILRCFSHSACEAYSDVRVLLCPGHLQKSHDHDHESREAAYRQIHIAIRNTSADRKTAHIELSARQRQLVTSALYQDLQLDLKKFYMYQCSAGEHPTRDLRIHVRPALLSSGERAAFDQVQPLNSEIRLEATRTTPSLHITGGEVMQLTEWETEWVDRERVVSGRVMEDWRTTCPCY
jgi:hypothetical protein